MKAVENQLYGDQVTNVYMLQATPLNSVDISTNFGVLVFNV